MEITHLPILKKTLKPLQKQMPKLERIKKHKDEAKDARVKADVNGKSFVYYLADDHFEKLRRKKDKVLKIKEEKIAVYQAIKKDGKEFYYLGDVELKGNVLSLFVSAENIEPKRALVTTFEVDESEEPEVIEPSPVLASAEDETVPNLVGAQIVDPELLLKPTRKPENDSRRLHRYSRKALKKKKKTRKIGAKSRRRNR
ncbi:hypothetical protein GCM10022297_13080 [Lactobacillus hamsteri]|uniref:Uncharacterized protein n=1 Tax=Lactobacillus hamsteri DSM 5661 = JCM 6256 TaxID=1423754 RepID=A0A0R1YDZ4_9LACO|nr:hypothetical protein [Lactobacillus hamsteri]KRM40573.1 hypothetical protein FC39_GL000388 [Lactobacillus hamsteri DSM 5661 = JCM 6256]